MICRANLDKINYLRPLLLRVLVPYHIKTLGAKTVPPGFDPPGLLREVIFSCNKCVDFIVSSWKIRPKNPSRPIFWETFIVATCPNKKRPKSVFLLFGQIGRYFQLVKGVLMQILSIWAYACLKRKIILFVKSLIFLKPGVKKA